MFNSDKVCLVEEWNDKLADIREAMNAFDHRFVCFENEIEDIDDKLDEMRLASHPTKKKKAGGNTGLRILALLWDLAMV